MKLLAAILMMMFLVSCSSDDSKFAKEKVCSNQALKYLKNPRNRNKIAPRNPALTKSVAATQKSMQLCYEDFRNRSGVEEFNTCLVVGVNESNETEFFNFSTREVEVDQRFMDCALAVAKSVPFGKYGSNYILIQSYEFYNNW
jgi:hypothetical protein